jgi:type II secretory pathway pseudopilin PulG
MIKFCNARIWKRSLGSQGITLIEVLAAMIVLAVGILSMAPMMTISITGSRFSNEVTTIAAEAQQRIEEQIGRGSFPTMPYIIADTVGDGKYAVRTEVRDETVDNSIPSLVYEISVTVGWLDDANLQRSMSFVTYGTKR